MYSCAHEPSRILVTCWRRPLPTYLGERTILDTSLLEVGEQPAVSAQRLHVALTMPEEEAERSVGVTS